MSRLSYEDISKNFYYDESSPSGLRWAIDSGKKSVGDVAGSKSYNKNKTPKCWDVRYSGFLFKAHRIIAILFGITLSDDLVVNHIDCNPFNNLISNLEVVKQTDNMRKCSSHIGLKLQSNNTSSINGVSVITINGIVKSYSASSRDENGERHSINFSVSKYGDTLAKKLAILTREHMIEELKMKGVNYG
jgi:hypothetical protein